VAVDAVGGAMEQHGATTELRVASPGVDDGRRCGVNGVVPLAVDAAAARPLLGISWPGDLSRKAPIGSRR
jgi:hypothetical protein